MLSSSKKLKVIAVALPDEEINQTYSVNNYYKGFGKDEGKRSSGLMGSIVNYANTMVGAGVLSLPWVLTQTGWVLGILLILLGCSSTYLGLNVFSKVCHLLGGDQLTWGSVSKITHPAMPFLAATIVWFYTVLVVMIYLGTAGSFLQDVSIALAGPNSDLSAIYYDRVFWVILTFACFAVPLSIPRKVSILKYTSTVAVGAILYTAGIVWYHASLDNDTLCRRFLDENNIFECIGDQCCVAEDSDECCIGTMRAMGNNLMEIVSSIPTLMTAFACASSTMPIYNDLSKPSVKRMNIAGGTAILLVLVLYASIAFAGYFSYGDKISSDLLASYPLSTDVTIARLAMAFVLSVSVPLLMHPSRDALVDMVQEIFALCGKRELTQQKTMKNVLFYSCLIFNLGIALLVAIQGYDIDVLLNLVGAIGVISSSFIFPGIFALRIMKEVGQLTTALKWQSIYLIVFGLLILVSNIIIWGVDGL